MTIRCKDCDCVLWSNESKKLKQCPECREEPPIEPLDLEDQFDKLFHVKHPSPSQ